MLKPPKHVHSFSVDFFDFLKFIEKLKARARALNLVVIFTLNPKLNAYGEFQTPAYNVATAQTKLQN